MPVGREVGRRGRPPGPANYLNLIARRGRMEGFITLDYWDRFPECMEQLERDILAELDIADPYRVQD